MKLFTIIIQKQQLSKTKPSTLGVCVHVCEHASVYKLLRKGQGLPAHQICE